MSQGKSILCSGLFGATIAAALAFGATQAVAAPNGGTVSEVCGSGTVCLTWCRMRGYDYGQCNDGHCACWYM